MANRRGLRILARIYQNLPLELIQRTSQNGGPTVRREGTAPQAIVPEPVHDRVSLEARLDRIEMMLGRLLTQKRVKTVERDADDLITRVIDEPMGPGEA